MKLWWLRLTFCASSPCVSPAASRILLEDLGDGAVLRVRVVALRHASGDVIREAPRITDYLPEG